MRQALNNLQATHSGFRFVNQENVFKVQPYTIFLLLAIPCTIAFVQSILGLKQ
jgi:hypothetical protein